MKIYPDFVKFAYNPPQLAIKLSSARHKMVVAGRGVGKTTMLADDMGDLARIMPRGKEGFIGQTYFHIKTKSMPVIINHWEKLGFKKDLHYFVGRKPPKTWGIIEAYMPPLDYKNAILFRNGYTIEFLSMDRPEMARSGSYDFLRGDEAAKIKHSALTADIFPANRGNNDRFGHLRRHHGTMFTTTHALNQLGHWVYDYEQYALEDKDYFYIEASARENIKILGENFFKDHKRTMPQILYNLEILNIKPKKLSNVFYPKFNYETHTYPPSYNYHFIDDDSDNNEGLLSATDSRIDADVLENQALDLSFDFGARINCLVVGQEQFPSYKIVRALFVLQPEIKSQLVENFIQKYRFHKNKLVYLYGGSDGNRRSDYDSSKTYFEKVIEQLNAAGWRVEPRYRLHEINHQKKFQFFNEYLAGLLIKHPALEINRENAKDLIISLENAPLKDHIIEKDKSSERQDIPQNEATHLSDAFDNLIYWKFSDEAYDYANFRGTSFR